jgi:predicted dehydrogenase
MPFLWAGRAKAAVPANDRIAVGAIGVGRMGMGDLRTMLGEEDVQVVAVCDVDRSRCQAAARTVNERYAKRAADGEFKGCAEYGDFRELIARSDIDAVMVCTPDHWHALPAIAAARAGKDIFIQKPLTYSVAEGRVLSDTVRQYGAVLQVGSQQRSDSRFRLACELVRNGYIGKVERVEVGCGIDPFTDNAPRMPVPEALDYDFWLGPAPWMPYTETCVHPAKGYGRPGWLRTYGFSIGMMTGWGSHHMDIAHWALDRMDKGPRYIDGWARYADDGAWTVHGDWDVRYVYDEGPDIYFGGNSRYAQGVTFLGTEGRIHVQRGKIEATPASLLREVIPPSGIHLQRSVGGHMHDFVHAMRTRSQPVAPVENGHRSCSVCILGDIAARLGRRLTWDYSRERFIADGMADRMLARPMRAPWCL